MDRVPGDKNNVPQEFKVWSYGRTYRYETVQRSATVEPATLTLKPPVAANLRVPCTIHGWSSPHKYRYRYRSSLESHSFRSRFYLDRTSYMKLNSAPLPHLSSRACKSRTSCRAPPEIQCCQHNYPGAHRQTPVCPRRTRTADAASHRYPRCPDPQACPPQTGNAP
jgi:hypothetical protein